MTLALLAYQAMATATVTDCSSQSNDVAPAFYVGDDCATTSDRCEVSGGGDLACSVDDGTATTASTYLWMVTDFAENGGNTLTVWGISSTLQRFCCYVTSASDASNLYIRGDDDPDVVDFLQMTYNGSGVSAPVNVEIEQTWVFANQGDDVINGSDYDIPGCDASCEVLFGDGGDDTISGNAGNDEILGGTHGDTIDGGDGDDDIRGEAGDDVIDAGDGTNSVHGGAGHDTIDGGGDTDTVYGEDGNDVIRGGGGDDFLYGEEDDDELYGETGIDLLHGGDDIDVLFGGAGNDELHGGDHFDILEGGPDTDMMYGEGGSDVLCGGTGTGDEFYGGTGFDAYWSPVSAVSPTGISAAGDHCCDDSGAGHSHGVSWAGGACTYDVTHQRRLEARGGVAG